MNSRVFSYVGTFVLALGCATAALAGSPRYSAKTPAIDLGSAHRFENNAQITLTIALKSRNADEMQALLKSIYTPGDPNFRRFLTPEEFGAKFGPAPETIDLVTRHFQAAGLNVERASVGHLRVSGSMAAVEREFGVSFHTFQVSATADTAAYRFRGPAGAAQLSASIAREVDAVAGLDNRPRYHPMLRRAQSTRHPHAVRPATAAPNTPNPPGAWTVADLAQYYDVMPLYKHGISGEGRTIGIVTLAAFTSSDASGSDETTLDVEQSGGLAPGAKIIVYQAPNTDQGFLDAFARAIHDNNADAISTSWGEWEEFFVQGTAISDPAAAGELRAFDNLFIQAAIQGESLSAAAGDSGSYDTSGELPPGFNDVLSVDHPASDPYILAAGGTTLPGEQQFLLNDGSTFTVNVAHERAWSWDYLNGLCAALGFDPVSCGIYPVGGGGGVSVIFPVPFYQDDLAGIRLSEPKQVLIDSTQTPPQKLLTLPSRFAGRNLPDISLNADPDTGYAVYYTSDVSGFAINDFWGGTSFVAPQLAGITTLLDQNAGGRIGLLNFALYELASRGEGYSGNHPPLRDIRKGDNEFYNAGPAYDQATGLGVLDVANLADQFH
jgi:kumamolisin